MGLEMTNVVIIILVLICVLALLSACCRGLRHAYEDHATNEELARRRALFMNRGTTETPTTRNGRGRGRPSNHTRAVRVTTISREGDTIAMGVYEIQVPRRPGGAVGARSLRQPANNPSSTSSRGSRQGTTVPRSQFKEPPPPPFNTAYQVSSPVTTTVIDMDAPPPTYDEYLRIHELEEECKKDSGPSGKY